MAAVMVSCGGAAMASMTARLISKLSVHPEDELVDLRNLKRLGTGFVAPRFYLVGKLNFACAVQFDFLSKCSTSDAEVVSFGGDIMAVPLHFFWIWVEVCDLPAKLTIDATVRLVGKTIGLVLNINQSGLMIGSTRVSVTLTLNNLVRIDRCLHVSPKYVIKVQYMYERLVGLCRDCMMLNHGGMVCPKAQEAVEETEDLNGPVAAAATPLIVFRANFQPALA
ncbi:hypothetical protein ACLB2K_050171 [Fragaria x ananassa]